MRSLAISAILITMCMAMVASGISLNLNMYNSDDSLGVSVDGSNLDFSGMAMLSPDSLFYQSAGSSTDTECSYSNGITFNGKTYETGTETDSGAFAWKASASSNYPVPGPEDLSLSATSFVMDGHMESYYSNPDHRVEESVLVNGAGYSGKTSITQDSLESSGGGRSLDPEFSYFQSQTMDGLTLSAGSETSSGMSQWFTDMNLLADGTKSSTISTTNLVEDGRMTIFCQNPDLKVLDDLTLSSAAYMQKAEISSDTIDLKGVGVTTSPITTGSSTTDAQVSDTEATDTQTTDTEATDTQSTDIKNPDAQSPDTQNPDTHTTDTTAEIKGVDQTLSVLKPDGRCGSVEMTVMGDGAEAQWGSTVNSDQSDYSFDLAITGTGIMPSMKEFSMVGQASDFPTQVLPAGDVNISSTTVPGIADDFNEFMNRLSNAENEFRNDYASEFDAKDSWYFLNQRTFVNPITGSESSTLDLPDRDCYHMSIGFNVKVKGNETN